MIAALVAAVGGAVAYGTGSVLQAAGARRVAAAGGHVLGVAREPSYLAGLGCDLAGWLLSLVALRQLPLFAVQAILAGSLAVTVVVAAVTLGASVRGIDAWAVAATVVALVVLGAAASPERAHPRHGAVEPALLAGVVLVAAATVAAARWSTPVVAGAASGIAFGGAALAARAVHARADVAGLVTEPLAIAVVAYGVVGMIGYAHALERGEVGTVTAALWVAETVVPGAIGLAVLGDHVRPGWVAPAAVAAAVAVATIVVLSRSPSPSSHPRGLTMASEPGGSN